MRLRLLAAALIFALSGCGVRGSLERPAPMWGEARAQYEAEQARMKQAGETPASVTPPLSPEPQPPIQPVPRSPIQAPLPQ
ncbi:MAG: lipoprotein [Hyphomonadaceae bacterium]